MQSSYIVGFLLQEYKDSEEFICVNEVVSFRSELFLNLGNP